MIRLPRNVVILLAVVLLVLVAVTLYLQYSSSQNTGPWVKTSPYPLQAGGAQGVIGQSCVTYSSTVYCVGGEDASNQPSPDVYYAPLLSSGLGNWSASQYEYPLPVMFTSCVADSGYVYCVGGTHTATGNDTSSSYFARVGSEGLGNWTRTSPYPIATDSQSCVGASGYIICLGGENETASTSASQTDSRSVWYATLTSSGIGQWARTVPYPTGVFFPECVAEGGYVYCVGGQTSSGGLVSASYYASVGPEGLGDWTGSSPYPVQESGPSCTISSTVVYCVGGLISGGSAGSGVYYSGLTPSGFGSWQQAGSYPANAVTDCVSSPQVLYCIGGYDPGSLPTPDTYYAPVPQSSASRSGSTG